ncbi:uncharacterized protein LOC110093037 [Dendrobium catenatum]|uniref:uncharacterized protein LOC110093037 n=1 Tax=Dendrobium catenatum TaxID=906689 RepID=UPI0009F53F4A|nr:uncharacterized protein LOC110093037 [Dendrobium catenatum]
MKFMNDNDYHDVGNFGPRYTWCNNKVGGGRILERLDRCILNSLSINEIQIAVVRHLDRVASDHSPIVLKIYESVSRGRRCIKFEDAWLSYKIATHIVSNRWKKVFMGDDMEVLNKKMQRTLKDLFYLSEVRLKEFSKVKDRLKAKIFQIQEEEARNGWLNEDKLLVLRAKVKDLNVILNCLNTLRENTRLPSDFSAKFFALERKNYGRMLMNLATKKLRRICRRIIRQKLSGVAMRR